MPRTLRIEADGGSRGNPGVAGYGALVRDESGRILAERAAPLGIASNNVAEYSGLIAGLDAVLAIDPGASVTAAMDSKLVVEQMAGRWKIKHEDMRRLALTARERIREIEKAGGTVVFVWIPRAQNAAADALSNDGMDGSTVCRGAGCDQSEPVGEQTDARIFDSPLDPWPAGEATRLILVRHGVTAFTEAQLLDGRGGADPSLSDLGHEQARNAARLVAALVGDEPATVTTSNLARAVQTGAAVADELGVGPAVDEDWDEQGYGDWDGSPIATLVQTHRSELGHLRADPHYRRPGGESHAEVEKRVLRAFERVVRGGGTSVVVCHRKPIMIALAHVLGLGQERSWRLATAPGSVTGIEVWPNGAATVAFTNRT